MSDYSYHTANSESAVDVQTEQSIKNIHTSLPAAVVSFNAAAQTVTLAAMVKQLMIDGATVNVPPLMDVPVSFPRGGGFAVTFPLKPGDEGIALFSERCIDGWYTSGKATEPLDYRYHDLSDAMFVPGICSQPNALGGFFNDGLSLQTVGGDTFIRIKAGEILIKGNVILQGSMSQSGGDTTSSGTIKSTADVLAGGVSLKGHVHGGVATGGSNTSTPK